MKIKYSGKKGWHFLLAFNTTTYDEYRKGTKGFFIEILKYRWDFILC
jgi:hypothetical protein